jgi:hypothetical protein
MRTLTWRTGCIAVALVAALFFQPDTSFGVDCSYPGNTPGNGAFEPPLPFDPSIPPNGFCVANGRYNTERSVNVPADSPLAIGEEGLTLEVTAKLPGGFFAPGSFRIGPGGTVQTVPDIEHPIWIHGEGDIRNDGGFLYLVAPQQPIRLRGVGIITLTGDPAVFNPPTFIWGDYVKLQTTKGSIKIVNALIMSSQPGVDFVAPKGDIFIGSTTIFVLEEGANAFGPCRFQVRKKGGQLLGLDSNGNSVPIGDPAANNVFICSQILIKK